MAAPSNPINALEFAANFPGTAWTPDSAYAVGTQSNKLLLVYVQSEESPTPALVTGVTFNTSESFTKVIDVTEGINHGSLWALVNPSNATTAIDITFDIDPENVVSIIWYHSDAEQVIPSEGEASNSNPGASETSISVDITTSGPDRRIVAGGGHGDTAAMSAGTGETLIHSMLQSSMVGAASHFVQSTAGTRAMDFTFSASRRPNIVGVAIRPVPSLPTGTGALIFNPFSMVTIGEQPYEATGVLIMTAEDLVAVGAMEPKGVGALTMTAEDLTAVGAVVAPSAGDVTVSVQSAALSTSGTGTTDFIKSGFGTPKACKIIVSFDTTDDTGVAAQSRVSIGFSDFTNHRCITHQDEDASAKVDCDALKSATKAYVILDAAGAVIIDGTASAITDGVRLTNTTNTNSDAPFVTVEMFGGADLVDDIRSTGINSTQDGTATITHAGLTDGNEKLIFFIGTDVSGEDSSSTGINSSFGVCHVSGNDAGGYTFVQRCIGWASDHNNAVGSPSAILSTDRVLDIITETGGQDWGLEVTAFSSSEGTITVTTRDAGAGAGMEVYSLIIDLDDRKAKVGSVTSPSGVSDWTPSVSLGFTPQYVGLGLTLLLSENSLQSGPQANSLAISSNTGSSEETCHSWHNQDASVETNTNNKFRSRAIDVIDFLATGPQYDLQHSSFNDGGWTYTSNVASSNIDKWFFCAIEEAAALAHIGTGAPTLEPLTIIAAGIMEADGVGVLTMTAEDLVAVGEQPHEGVGALTMTAEDLVAVGEQPHEGAGALAMTAEDLVAVGEQSEPEGVGDLTMQPEDMTATGVMQPEGTGTPTLEAVVLAAVGQVPFEGVGAMNFQELILNAVGAVPFEGAAVPTLEALAMVAVGVMEADGTGAPELQDLVMTAAGVQKFLGTSLPTLEAMTLVTAGEMLSSGTGAPELQDIILAAQGVEKFLGTGVLTLEVMALAAVGAMQPDGTGSPALEDLILATQGEQPHEGAGAPTLQDMVLAAVGVHGAPEGVGALIMAAQELVAQGHENPDGVGALDLAAEELIAQGQMPSEGVGNVTLQDFLLTAAGAQAGAGLSRAFKMLLRPRRRPGQGKGK